MKGLYALLFLLAAGVICLSCRQEANPTKDSFSQTTKAEISGSVEETSGDSQDMNNIQLETVKPKELAFLQSSTVYGPTKEDPSPELTYARIIELAHNGEHNGMLLATGESLNVARYLIHRSTDGGKNFETVGAVKAKNGKMIANWQPMLYELPCAVGDLPEGTILLAGCTRNIDTTRTEMTVYASTDLGENWSYVSTVANGGGFGQVNGLSNGLWEPFLLCDESGTLYCFYSDETDCENHSQMIVCRSSQDGVNWSETQRIVACGNQSLRPGMPTVTKMGNGRYFLTYEMVGMNGNPIYYKTTADLTDWGNPSDFGTAVRSNKGVSVGSTPYCCWISGGSENGTLIVTGKNMVEGASKTGTDWLVSYDYGKTFRNINNPLPYKDDGAFRYAYSPCVFAGSDGQTLYYVNNINSGVVKGKAKIQLAVLKVSANASNSGL